MPARKPSALKQRQGTLRKSRLNQHAPAPKAGLPAVPKGLSPRSRKAWKELARVLLDLEVLTPADGLALRLLSDAFDEYLEADHAVRSHGLVYQTETESGSVMYRPRPEVAIRADAQRRLFRIAQSFGLTPADRDKVSRVLEVDDPGAEFLA